MGEVARFVGRRVIMKRTDFSEAHLGTVVFETLQAETEKVQRRNPQALAVRNMSVINLPAATVAECESRFRDIVNDIEAKTGLPRHAHKPGERSAFSIALKQNPHLFACSRANPVESLSDADVELL